MKTIKDKLTLKQRLFCRYYVEMLGNGTEAVIQAGYEICKKDDYPDRSLAKSIASENLTKPYICDHIRSLLDKNGLNDVVAKKELMFLINQYADLGVKVRAIDLYFKITGAYSPTKIEHGASQEVEEALERLHKMLPD